ncbi:MAG TPA: hypothetical protein DCE23_01080 [Firmicutes bacterium]|nr:hypothetical protein [Bacillota bacterium]
MKIKKYTKVRGNKYNVLIDSEEVKLYDDVIVHFELLRKDEIDEDLYNEIIEYNKSLEAYYKSLRYITKKLRTEKEIYDYLVKDYTRNVTNKTIDRLKKDGYLNEEIYLKCYFTDMINLRSFGPNKIKKDLIKLGYEEDVINGKLNEIDDKVWFNKIDNIVKKKIACNKSYGNSKLKEKILYDLSNMGYYKWMIEEVINSCEFSSNDDILMKEYNKIYNKLCNKYAGYDLDSKIIIKLVSKGFFYEEAKRIVAQNKKD